jgi:hypothetical protein
MNLWDLKAVDHFSNLEFSCIYMNRRSFWLDGQRDVFSLKGGNTEMFLF